jgi:hypothetical protein
MTIRWDVDGSRVRKVRRYFSEDSRMRKTRIELRRTDLRSEI